MAKRVIDNNEGGNNSTTVIVKSRDVYPTGAWGPGNIPQGIIALFQYPPGGPGGRGWNYFHTRFLDIWWCNICYSILQGGVGGALLKSLITAISPLLKI
ncbi:MAG: hypothetical protein ACYTEQ_19175 [Planctomycetota bacterium]